MIASNPTAPRTSMPLDKLSLGAHVRACDRARGRAFVLHCLGERLHGVLGPRFFTTVFGVAALMAVLAGCI